MGKLSFRYMIKPKPAHMNAFKYIWGKLTEYGLAYQRYAALSDASIFHSPVGITKIAAGLSNLCELFVSPVHEMEIYDETVIEKKPFDSVTDDVPVFGGRDNRYQISRPEPEEFASYERHLRIYNNIVMAPSPHSNLFKLLPQITADKINGSNMTILPMYFIYGPDHNMEILKDIFGSRRQDFYDVNYLDNIFAKRENYSVTLHKLVNAVRPHLRMKILKDTILKRPDLRMEILKDINAHRPDLEMKILELVFGWIPDPVLNIMNQPSLYRNHTYTADINKDVSGETYQLYGFAYDILNAYGGENVVNYVSFLSGKMGNETLNSFQTELASKPGLTLNKFEQEHCKHNPIYADVNNLITAEASKKIAVTTPWAVISSGSNIRYGMNLDDMFYSIKPKEKTAYTFDLTSFTIQETKFAIVIEGMNAFNNYKEAMMPDIPLPVFKSGKLGFVRDSVDSAIGNSKTLYYEYGSLEIYKGGHESNIPEALIAGLKDDKNALMSRELIGMSHRKRKSSSMDSGIYLEKDKIMTSIVRSGIFLGKIPKDLNILDAGIDLYKLQRHMSIADSAICLYQIKKDINIALPPFFLYKVPKDLQCNLDECWLYKVPKDIESINSGLSIYKIPGLLDLESFAHIVWNTPDRVGGLSTGLFNEAEAAIKTIKHIHLANMIIPFSKVNRFCAVDKLHESAMKIFSSCTWFSKEMWASVMPRPVWTEPGLWMDKESIQGMVDVQNYWLLKERIKTAIYEGIMLPLGKEPNKLAVFKDEWVSKNGRLVGVIWENVHAWKDKKELDIHKDIFYTKDYSHNGLYVFKDDWLKKRLDLNYYSYGLMTDRINNHPMEIQRDESVKKDKYNMDTIDFISPVLRDPDLRIWYDELVISERSLKEFGIYEQLKWLEDTRKKLMLHPNDFGNWVWVYETPDPIQGEPYGIDELLLPENDTQYENLKEIIFDKENLRPRNPVKVIDDTTFIAKYPIRHPSKDHFAHLAIDYDASAYKWENYYGIRTEIMHVCFLKYYRIWEAKMFDFSTMTMTQSVNQMLEYMYAWMIDYFPLDELEEAFRVLRLIRWYGETAIIQNSQYIISYEYDILESKLTTGKCFVPNDLHEAAGDGKTNDTMFVDASLGVIRNNPIYIGNGPASVEFYIDNKKNTTFTFSLSNTVGSVNIYINGVLVDTKPTTVLNLTYELPAIGDTNVIRIEKPAAHNLNAQFYIGNIKVPDCSFKDLTIEFDPKLRAGNKPLDSISKKLVQFAQLHENRDEVYDMIFKQNLGINEVYRKMLEYWELHHAGKIKGKRLTIKKS